MFPTSQASGFRNSASSRIQHSASNLRASALGAGAQPPSSDDRTLRGPSQSGARGSVFYVEEKDINENDVILGRGISERYKGNKRFRDNAQTLIRDCVNDKKLPANVVQWLDNHPNTDEARNLSEKFNKMSLTTIQDVPRKLKPFLMAHLVYQTETATPPGRFLARVKDNEHLLEEIPRKKRLEKAGQEMRDLSRAKAIEKSLEDFRQSKQKTRPKTKDSQKKRNQPEKSAKTPMSILKTKQKRMTLNKKNTRFETSSASEAKQQPGVKHQRGDLKQNPNQNRDTRSNDYPVGYSEHDKYRPNVRNHQAHGSSSYFGYDPRASYTQRQPSYNVGSYTDTYQGASFQRRPEYHHLGSQPRSSYDYSTGYTANFDYSNRNYSGNYYSRGTSPHGALHHGHHTPSANYHPTSGYHPTYSDHPTSGYYPSSTHQQSYGDQWTYSNSARRPDVGRPYHHSASIHSRQGTSENPNANIDHLTLTSSNSAESYGPLDVSHGIEMTNSEADDIGKILNSHSK